MAPKFQQYQYGGVNGDNAHDFQPTGKKFVLQYVHMGACAEDLVEESLCTKCGLSAHFHRYNVKDCPVA